MQFRKKFGEANVTSLVERVSRFTVFLRNNDRQSRPIMERLIRTLEALPAIALAERHGREHQSARTQMAFERG